MTHLVRTDIGRGPQGFPNDAEGVAMVEAAQAAAEAAQAAAEAAAEAAVDISGISVDDDIVEALVKNTGGAGPKTSAALSASITDAAAVERYISDQSYAAYGGAPLVQSPGKNLVDVLAGQDNKFWNGSNNGTPATPVTLANFWSSAQFAVTPGATITAGAGIRTIEFFAADGSTDGGGFVNDATLAVKTVTVPVGKTFMAVSCPAANKGAVQVEVGAVATTFESFGVKGPPRELIIGLDGLYEYRDTKTVRLETLAARIEAGLTVYRSGNSVLIRHPHDSTTDLVTPLDLNRATTYGDTRVRMALTSWNYVRTIDKALVDGAIWPIPATNPGTKVQIADDDNAPINAGTSYIGGNHGWGAGAKITLTAHGKTTADLGSTWTDGTRTFTLLRIIDANNLLFGNPYTVASGRVTVSTIGPSTTLTHVSGATHTTSVSIAGGNVFMQVGPVSHSRTVDVKIDGQRLNDGVTHGVVLEVVETYTVISYKGLVDWSQANVGTDPFADLTVKTGLCRVSNTFRWTGDRNVVVGQTITPLEEFVGWMMVTQAVGVELPASGSQRQYFPGATGTLVGLNLATEANLTSSQSGDLTITSTQQQQANDPISRTYQWGYTSGGARAYGLLLGLLPVMDGKPATRKTNGTDTASWHMPTGTKKNYPRLTGPTQVFAVGQSYSGLAFRRYLSPEDPDVTVISDGARWWVLIDTPTAHASATVAKAPRVQGRTLVDVETATVTPAKTYVTPEGITYTNTAPGHLMAEATVDTSV